MKTNFHRTTLILVILLFLLQGCAATQQRRDVVETGFLSASEHSMLTEGKGDHEALLRYINPDVDWRSYNKVMIDSVAVWKNEETKDVAPEDLQKLTDFLYGQLHDALSRDYTIVTEPGSGVMRDWSQRSHRGRQAGLCWDGRLGNKGHRRTNREDSGYGRRSAWGHQRSQWHD